MLLRPPRRLNSWLHSVINSSQIWPLIIRILQPFHELSMMSHMCSCLICSAPITDTFRSKISAICMNFCLHWMRRRGEAVSRLRAKRSRRKLDSRYRAYSRRLTCYGVRSRSHVKYASHPQCTSFPTPLSAVNTRAATYQQRQKEHIQSQSQHSHHQP